MGAFCRHNFPKLGATELVLSNGMKASRDDLTNLIVGSLWLVLQHILNAAQQLLV